MVLKVFFFLVFVVVVVGSIPGLPVCLSFHQFVYDIHYMRRVLRGGVIKWCSCMTITKVVVVISIEKNRFVRRY